MAHKATAASLNFQCLEASQKQMPGLDNLYTLCGRKIKNSGEVCIETACPAEVARAVAELADIDLLKPSEALHALPSS